MTLILILALVFALLVAVFATQNAAPVPVRFLAWDFPEISLVLIILGSAVIGALCVGLVGLFKQIGMSLKIRDYQNKIRKYEAENKALKEREQKLEEELNQLKTQLQTPQRDAGARGISSAGG